MEKIKYYNLIVIFTIFSLIFTTYPGFADDTCVFSVTADDIPPNITILLDSGAEMEQIVWHSGYDNSIDYTPSVTPEVDVVEPGGASPDSGTLTLINVTNSNFFPGYIKVAISPVKQDLVKVWSIMLLPLRTCYVVYQILWLMLSINACQMFTLLSELN